METYSLKTAKESTQERINRALVILTFRTQELLNLWENEMQGQISDGFWENSKGGEWLWKNTAVRLGNETKVEYTAYWVDARKKSFPLSSVLCGFIGERAQIEAGFTSLDEMKAGWKEINSAIKAVSYNKELDIVRCQTEKEDSIKAAHYEKNFRKKLIDQGFNPQYEFSYKKVIGEYQGESLTVDIDPRTLTKDFRFQIRTIYYKYAAPNPFYKEVYIKFEQLDKYVKGVLAFFAQF